MSEHPRVGVFVDGYNLYYGCLRGPGRKWLNLKDFASALLASDAAPKRLRRITSEHEISTLWYFTARASARPDDPSLPDRQNAYFRALQSIENLHIELGKFLQHGKGNPQEKGSDVNLATRLLLGAFDSEYDIALVITNDSDLTTPVTAVQERFNLPVVVALPVLADGRRPSVQLRRAARHTIDIDRRCLSIITSSQFPDEVIDREGRTVRKPADW